MVWYLLECFMLQYNVGWCYRYGCGVARNYDLAFHWYSKAAEQNYCHGMFAVGKAYSKGWGVEHDPVKAFEWWPCSLLPSLFLILLTRPRTSQVHARCRSRKWGSSVQPWMLLRSRTGTRTAGPRSPSKS